MFGDSFGNPQLHGLKEIALPEPVSYMPQAAGWLILLAFILMLLAWWGYRRYLAWLSDHYRRDALKILDGIERSLISPETRGGALMQIPIIMKCVAIHAYGRQEVAQLSGERWLTFLDRTLEREGFAKGKGRILSDLSYQKKEMVNRISDEEAAGLVALAKEWVRFHKAHGRK